MRWRPSCAPWKKRWSARDVFVGLSAKGAVTKEMVKTMAKAPIIFAMANPDPEITPEDVKAARPDAIVATGRSDYPNQVNNVSGLSLYLPRRAGCARPTINERDEDRRRRSHRRPWRAKMCRTKWRPPIAARGRFMAPITLFLRRSIRA